MHWEYVILLFVDVAKDVAKIFQTKMPRFFHTILSASNTTVVVFAIRVAATLVIQLCQMRLELWQGFQATNASIKGLRGWLLHSLKLTVRP